MASSVAFGMWAAIIVWRDCSSTRKSDLPEGVMWPGGTICTQSGMLPRSMPRVSLSFAWPELQTTNINSALSNASSLRNQILKQLTAYLAPVFVLDHDVRPGRDGDM